MRNPIPILLVAFASLAAPVAAVSGAPPPANLKSEASDLKSQISNLRSQISNIRSEISDPKSEETVRELLVPFGDLSVLLEGDPNRVLLSREEYDALLAKAKKEAEARAPRQALLISADYDAKVGDERAEISGTLVVSVLEDGLRGREPDGRGQPSGGLAPLVLGLYFS